MDRTKCAMRWVVGVLMLAGLAGRAARAQEGGEGFVKPSPQHAFLKKEEGTWDATMKIFMGGPDAPPETCKGVEKNKMLGGFWLISEYEGDFGGQPFSGLGTVGYDPVKKKYIGSWVDSVTPHLTLMEGTYDEAKKTLTLLTEGINPATGKPVKERHLHEYKDEDTRILKMYQEGEGGKDVLMMELTYKRRKS